MKKYLYIFTRTDLKPSQIAVQSIHSAFELGKRYIGSHPSIVLLNMRNSKDLEKLEHFLKEKNIDFESFYEPYYKSLTSISVLPINEHQREIFKDFNLIKDNNFRG